MHPRLSLQGWELCLGNSQHCTLGLPSSECFDVASVIHALGEYFLWDVSPGVSSSDDALPLGEGSTSFTSW